MHDKNNTDLSIASQCEWVARLFAIVVAALGMAVLAGWAFDIASLKSVAAGWVTMKANTAIGFLLAGTSLFFAGQGADAPICSRKRVVLAAAVALIGLLTLGEYTFDADFGIDQLFFRADPEPVSHTAPGRMAVATAAGFALTGLALATLDSIRWRVVTLAAAMAGNLIGMLAILGYLYDVAALYGVGAYSSVALHTAAGFMIINLGVLFARPRIGLMAIVTSNTVGGVIVRRLLPLALIAPFLIGWLRVEAEKLGWVSSSFGVALVTLTYVALFTVLILRTGFVLLACNQKLLESELHHRTLVEWSPEAILVHRDGHLLYLNPAANRMFGAPPGPGLTGQSIAALAHPDFRNIMLGRAQCHVEAGASMPQIEVKFIKLDGTAIDVEVHDTVIVHDGRPAIHSSMRDITERKRAQEVRAELRNLVIHQEIVREEERKRIALEIHDELGQNLMALRLDVAVIAAGGGSRAATIKRADITLKQIDMTIKSIRAIMNDLRPAVLNLGLHAAIEWQVKQFTLHTGIVCNLHLDHDEFSLADKNAAFLFRIVQELLTNITQHAQAQHVQIELLYQDGWFVVKIIDDGIGLHPNDRRKVNTFGLAMIEERIYAMGGIFSAVSNPGQGMAIMVSIPVPIDVIESEDFLEPDHTCTQDLESCQTLSC